VQNNYDSGSVSLQEELDWECYHAYGLVPENLTFIAAELPAIQLGQRAFEIVIAADCRWCAADNVV
jgi:hypothetical protein